MPDGYIPLASTAEAIEAARRLVKAWEDDGKVGPHPASRQARFERGELVLPAIAHRVYRIVPEPRR